MERKAKVTQDAVSAACQQLTDDNKNVTVNAVIAITGGSFSTVGVMVKAWKEDQGAKLAPLISMPESITQSMHRATAEIWTTASDLACESIERIQSEAGESISTAKAELSEYKTEVTRLESELGQAHTKTAEVEQLLSKSVQEVNALNTEKVSLQVRLSDREQELVRVRSDYEKLQSELIEIAKMQAKQKKGE